MKKHLKELPWYYLVIAIWFILRPMLEKIVLSYYDEDTVTKCLSYQISVHDILPIAGAAVLFVICTIVFVVRHYRAKFDKNNNTITESDLGSLTNSLKSFVREYNEIESLQAFTYTTLNYTVLKQKVYKVEFLTGAAKENIEINTILQTYYYFPYSIFRKMSSVASRYDKYRNEQDLSMKRVYKDEFKENGNNLCLEIKQTLDSLNDPSKLEEIHCGMYRILARLLPTVTETACATFLENSNLENALIKRKKTGLLGSILMRDLYIFRNQTSATKENRVYFTFPYKARGINRVVLLGSINGTDYDEPEPALTLCRRIATSICERNQ